MKAFPSDFRLEGLRIRCLLAQASAIVDSAEQAINIISEMPVPRRVRYIRDLKGYLEEANILHAKARRMHDSFQHVLEIFRSRREIDANIPSRMLVAYANCDMVGRDIDASIEHLRALAIETVDTAAAAS